MSGQPPRAAGPAPRLLLYVAEPRRPEPAPPPLHFHAQPAPLDHSTNNAYRVPVDTNHHNASASAVFYKSMSEQDNGFVSFANNSVTQIPEFYQQFVKEQCLKIDKVDDQACNVGVKRDCASTLSGEFNCIETLSGRGAVEQGEVVTYQTRCPPQVCSDNTMPPKQPMVIRNQNQFESVQSVNSDLNCPDRDISVDKCFVNYQLLEQSVSHQSIVNQSISILNQQVGVSQRIVSEGESVSPQLVRTVDGVVLAVLPGGPPPATDTDKQPPNTELTQTITVPLGWKRILHGTSIVYLSPSGNAISTIPQLREYLQTAGTCKCGLPCPLRPETAFSFDPKVASKPYQPASGAELTKLCNHKRKLLATLQARAQSPATPPLQQIETKKVVSTEVAVLKKKMKKRNSFPHNANVSQMMLHRERSINEYKIQDNEHRTVSSVVNQRVNNVQQQQPAMNNFSTLQQNMQMPAENEIKQETVQRSSHYLTVSSGWITQQKQENIEAGKQIPISQNSGNPTLNVGLPVLGTNGQIIGVNTGYNKHANYKNLVGVVSQNSIDQDSKEDKKEFVHQNQAAKKMNKEEEPQIFCGLNQPLTPEVMQKINEQQQLFIQQNQKQIEMARKGYKPQLSEIQSKPMNQNQYVPQAQLVIQNGAVVKTNPAKTPPWQVKKSDSIISLTSPSPKPHRLENSDYEESNASFSEESSGSSSSFQNNDHLINQVMCSRVPPLPQDYHMMGQQWPAVEMGKKKYKSNTKGAKKKNSPTDNKVMNFGNNGVRILQDGKINAFEDMPSPVNNVPSFMDDPNGYLAQQTVLLNNTISRQVGINPNFDGNQYENSNFNMHNQIDRACKHDIKITETSTFRPNTVPNASPSPNNTPDSSVVGNEPACCQPGAPGDTHNTHEQMRYRYVKQSNFKMDFDAGSYAAPSPRNRLDESSVTSTFPERSPPGPGGPIQGGTVSTSRVSPDASTPPPAPSPAPAPHNAHVVHFISNHNVNKNLMEVDNIGVRGSLPAYCPPPHLGGGPARSWSGPLQRVSTMASGLSVTRDTVTSVLAGRATTATTSTAAAARPPPRPDPAAACAIPPHRPDPFLDSVALPTSYPLHIAGTTAQNMISRLPYDILSRTSNNSNEQSTMGRRSCSSTSPGQILISSMGQIIVSSSNMPPPPPKTSSSTAATSIGGGQSGGMVVNTMPGQFVLQPPMVTVDGQSVQHSPTHQQLITGIDGTRVGEQKGSPGVALLSPESLKRKSRKKKTQAANITNMVQISPPGGNIVVQSGGGAQFSPRGFAVSPPGSLQALTIVPAKSAPHLVVPPPAFPAPPSQQINLLQPVNLINNGSGVVPNFPAFQQFIVPNLGGMVMTPDGTAIIQDGSSGMPVQLQLQTVNGQNVLTPVQNPNVFAAGANGGVVIRPPNQGKIIQSQHSPGAQFLSPNAQVMMGSPNFNGQLSPLLANLSPTNVTFNTSPHRVRSSNVQAQEFIQTNQVGQTLMVPISPKQASITVPSANHRSSTFVQQNTTIVQQQTTLVSNSHSAQIPPVTPNLQGATSRLSVDSTKSNNVREKRPLDVADGVERKDLESVDYASSHSVSTQTRGKSPGRSPPDTTTHSPLGALEPPDTTTHSPEPADANSSAMVQCVSSSEQDMLEAQSRLELLPTHRRPSTHRIANENDHNMMTNMQMRQNRSHNPVESTDLHYNQSMNATVNNQQHMMTSHYYERTQTYKRKSDFGEVSPYRTDKMMRTNYNMVHGLPKEEFDMRMSQEQSQRHYSQSGSSTDTHVMHKVYERHNIGSGNGKTLATNKERSGSEHVSVEGSKRGCRTFQAGEVVWGPVRGHPSWPGVVCGRLGGSRVTVRWFGARPRSAVSEDTLLTLSEGLEAHHAASTHQRKSRKLNTLLENAIQEAMAELDKKSESRRSSEDASQESNDLNELSPISETPKRSRKLDNIRSKNKHPKRSSLKTASNPQKTGDGARLRSSR